MIKIGLKLRYFDYSHLYNSHRPDFFKLATFFSGPAAYMLPRSSVSKPMTPAYTMRPKPNVGSFTEDLAKVN